jgi:hypothetical protein
MLKKLFFAAALLLAPLLVYAAVPSATLSVQVVPATAAGGPSNMLWGVFPSGYNQISRKADFSEGGVDISNGSPFPNCPTNNGSNYPIVVGVGGPAEPNIPSLSQAASGAYNSTYANTINSFVSAGCASSIYLVRPDNEWWLTCGPTNPWYDATNNPSCDTSKPAVATPTTFGQAECQYIGVIRSILPNAKIAVYGPNQANQAVYTDAVMSLCHPEVISFDLYFSNVFGASSSQSQWQSYCGSLTTTCTPSSGLGFLSNYAQGKGVPIFITEWCSEWHDTTGPHGGDFSTWNFFTWMTQNNVVGATLFTPGDGGLACDVAANPQEGIELNAFWGSTSYTGSFWTYKRTP